MSQLISELKQEHSKIARILADASQLGPESKLGRQKLLEAKSGLLAHLKREDEHLYPALHRAALVNPELKTTLDGFARDMKEITQVAVEFFAKYESGGSGLGFARDVGGLVAALKSRIRREEEVLYREFIKITA